LAPNPFLIEERLPSLNKGSQAVGILQHLIEYIAYSKVIYALGATRKAKACPSQSGSDKVKNQNLHEFHPPKKKHKIDIMNQ